jgi:hypothetical protein
MAVSRSSDRALRRWTVAGIALAVVVISAISALTAAFPDTPLTEVADWAAGNGFAALEVACWPTGDGAARRFDVGPVTYLAGRTRLSASGSVSPPEAGAGFWAVSLTSGPGVLGAERPGERDVPIDRAALTARVDVASKTFVAVAMKCSM